VTGRFNWKLWALLGGGTEIFLIISATRWAPSRFTYFLAVLFLPVMLLTAFWSRKYFLLDQEKQALSHRADRNLQEMARFFETATAVSDLSRLGENLDTLAAKLSELLDVEICGFFLYQEGLESLIAPAPPSGLREDRLFGQMRLNQLRFAANASSLIGRIFVTQEPLIIPDCQHDGEAAQLLPDQFGYRDMLLVPLGAAGRPVGVLMLANKRHDVFSAYDVKLATSLGSEVAISIENTMLFEQTRKQALRLDASIEMLRNVSQALTVTSPQSLLRAVVQAVQALSGAPACVITLSQGSAQLQAAEVSEGFRPALEGRSFGQLSPGIITQVVLEQRAIFSEDLKQDARFPSDPLASQYGLHAALAVPMFRQKELAGTLSLYYQEPMPVDPTLMQVLQILATQAAVALDNARRYQRERETIEMLRRANVELQEADRMKSEFLTNLSHELRTPLNAIIGFSEILHTMPDLSADERAEFSDNIHRSGRRLLKLINDLLDLTTIRAGRLKLQPQSCLVAEAVDAALSENAPAANQKNLTVFSEVPRGLQVTFDPRSLRHIVYNLVNNAIKFTPQHGRVTVAASRTPEGTVVEVRDTGIGIRHEDQVRLFEEFQQLDGSTARAFEGSGLGLVLSKRLVEMQGGRIWVESEPGRGSSFRFLIPATPSLARVA